MLIIYSQAVRLPTRTGDNNLKNNHRIKLIAASLALTTSLSAVGGLGGLNVQSNLGEPFSGTVTVTGEEAKVLLNGGNATLSDGNLRTSVRKSGDKAVINIRSNTPINDPVLVFQVGVGSQSRQYTAIIDPADYAAGNATTVQSGRPAEVETGESSPPRHSSQAKPNSNKNNQDTAKAKKDNKKAATQAKPERNRDVTSAGQKNPVVAEGGYKVRHGETLTFIAEKVRPQGLSVVETINALVLANPKVFPDNNPDIVIAGSTLNIPSAEELKSLSKQGVATPKPKKEETVAEVSPPQVQASQPVTSIETADVAEQVPQTESTVAEHTASQPVPTQVQEAEVSPPAAVTEETAKPETKASAAPAVAEESGSSGWWRWLLFAGLGAIALWLLLKFAAKKKDDVENTDENDHVILKEVTEENNLHAQNLGSSSISKTAPYAERSEHSFTRPEIAAGASAVAVAAATQAKTEESKVEEGLDIEDDFDDEIFFTETEAVPADKPENNFSLDLGSIDRAQNGIVSGALTQDEETQKREHANWDTIESTDSVYEPEPESEYQHVAVEFTPDAETLEVEGAADSFEISVHEENRFESSEPEQEAVSLEFDTEEHEDVEVTQEATILEEEPSEESETVTTEADTVEFEPLEFESSVVPETDNQPHDEETLAFEQPSSGQEETTAADSVESVTIDFETETVVAQEAAKTAGEVHDSTFVAEKAADTGWVSEEPDDGIAFQDEELGKPAEVNVSADDDTAIEWESIELGSDDERSESSFISESVGMTAPLEAKYELAQMYVEIGDPDAARETLQELLEEANGSILEKTKTMLAELNK